VKVIIGVDPYKSVNAVAAIDGDGELLGHEVFPATRPRPACPVSA